MDVEGHVVGMRIMCMVRASRAPAADDPRHRPVDPDQIARRQRMRHDHTASLTRQRWRRPSTVGVRACVESRVPRSISATARTGCAPPCSAPTTASCRPRASCSAWPRPARRAARSSPPGSPGWSPGRCRWPPGSTCRSARSATPSRPTSAWRSASCAATRAGELRELAGVYEQRGLPPALASEVAWPCRAAARWRRTPATSSGSTRSGWRGRSRPRGRRRSRSRRARRCRCWRSR